MAPKLLFALVSLILWSTAAEAAPPMWVVRGPHAEVVLFGSVHLLSAATQWRTPAFDAALTHADEVWFEIPFDEASQRAAGQAALARGLLTEGQTLSGLLSPEERGALTHLEAAEGISPASLDHFKPWLADTTLSIVYFQKRGAAASLGVEEQISAGLPPNKTRGALETAEQQIGFFADLPLKDQISSLDETLHEIESDPGAFDRLSSAWARGDVKTIDKEAVETLRKDAPVTYQRLVADRNQRWVETILKLLQGERRIFIVVGVGHLVGPDSVPALLRARGVIVEGP